MIRSAYWAVRYPGYYRRFQPACQLENGWFMTNNETAGYWCGEGIRIPMGVFAGVLDRIYTEGIQEKKDGEAGVADRINDLDALALTVVFELFYGEIFGNMDKE